ncbi:protein-L-isoaspartate O-methyltransferase [Acidobacteria bacterium Mor1]|nr:protein-L-isoaspartate O-methyltransferase [Acidobacteria bacterium Mor1]
MLAAGGCGSPEPSPDTTSEEDYAVMRDEMVAEQIESRGIRDPAVLKALRTVPRELFVPLEDRRFAYRDAPLRIGFDQTISQPYIVALMTELVRPQPGMKVLEVGTGSGYQAAVLAQCEVELYSIEILPGLADRARGILAELGYGNVKIRTGDGFDGWPEEAPFDAIIVTAAPPTIPQPLLDQLGPGGRLVIPVGRLNQDLLVVTRTEDGRFERETKAGVRFVPMTGKIEEGP